jgi:ADP-ribosylglycohydrolase
MPHRDFSHYSGCLLGGAIGDALGAPVEFETLANLRRKYGFQGVTRFVNRDEQSLAEFTDDTQMTLFTAEGLLIARQRGAWTPTEAIYRGYLRWLRTQRSRQTGPTGELTREGWLLGIPQQP